MKGKNNKKIKVKEKRKRKQWLGKANQKKSKTRGRVENRKGKREIYNIKEKREEKRKYTTAKNIKIK